MRPSVDLPEPDSPTMPRVSPRRSSRLTPSTARTGSRRPAAEQAALGRIVLGQVTDLEQRRSAGRGRGAGGTVRPGMRAAGAAGCRRAAARRSTSRTGTGLDDPAVMHDHHPVGDVGDHAEIVGDQQEPHPGLAQEIAQELQDLRLDGDVECRGRLVGDQQRGALASAMAIITRCRCPPENWCG